MRRTHNVARKVHALLPNQLACVGEIIFNPHFSIVLNGIIIDGTAYKDTVTAKRLQHVFFKRDTTPCLNYSTRIYNESDPRQVTFFVGKVDELAAQVAATLTLTGVVDSLLQPYTIQDFMAEHLPDDLPTYYQTRSLFDACCASVLLGRSEAARLGFLRYKLRWDRYFAEHIGHPPNEADDACRREANEIVALLDGNDDALRQHILRNVDRNARLLGFEPAGLSS